MTKVKKSEIKVTVSSISNETTLVCYKLEKVIHKKFKKVVFKTKKYMVHNAKKNIYNVGDELYIQSCRPISARKRWVVISGEVKQ